MKQPSNSTTDAGTGASGQQFIFLGLLYTLAFGAFFHLFSTLALAHDQNTIEEHIRAARLLAEGMRMVPHFGYHWTLILLNHLGLSYEYAAAYTLATACTLSLGLLHHLIRLETGMRAMGLAAFALAAVTLLCAAIHVPDGSGNFYHGTGAVSVWENSTMLFVRPLGLIAFLAFLAAFDRGREIDLRRAALAGLLCAITVIGKPNFALVFLPAVALWMLYRRMWMRRDIIAGILLAAPSVLVLGAQYVLVFGSGARRLTPDDFSQWASKFPDVPLALLLTLAFPLALAAFRARALLSNTPLQIAWLMVIVGTLQRGLITESVHAVSGNWSWGFMLALTFVFVLSITELVNWVDEQRDNRMRGCQAFCVVLLGLHLLAGIGFYAASYP